MTKLLLSFSLVFVTFLLNAQIFFGPPNDIAAPAVAGPEAFYAADLDGDFDLDLVVCSAGNRSVIWYEKLNNSKDFGPPQFLVDDVPQPADVICVDVDNDEDMDIVYGSWEKSELAMLINTDGLGTFSEKIVIDASCSGIWRIHYADVDGDQDRDLLVALREGNALKWYENDHGMFEKRTIYDYEDSNLRDAYPADIDGDGDVDVVTGDWYDAFIAWHENLDGKGTFSDKKVIYDQADGVDKVFCKDFDGDGDQDVLTYNGDNMIWIENGDGKGNFTTVTNISEGERIGDYDPIDFDGDGDQDILVSASNEGKAAWYKNSGNGAFGDLILITELFFGSDQVMGGDIDADGDVDVFGSGWAKSQLLWYENLDGNGNTGIPTIIDRPQLTSPVDMEQADFDKDGDKDIIVASLFDGSIYLVENDQFRDYGDISTIDYGISTILDLHVADLNIDGHLDVLWCNDGGEISWNVNNTSLNFGPRTQIADQGWGTSAVTSMDVNNDGVPDVIVANKWQNEIGVYYNSGANFGPYEVISKQLSTPSSFYVMDLNGDNYKELIVSSKIADKVVYFPNNGNGSFGDPVTVADDNNGPGKPFCDDMNGDGHPDILTAGYDFAYYYPNDGQGNFAEKISISGESANLGYVIDIKTGDPDGDGDRDVFLALEDKEKVVCYTWDETNGEFYRDFEKDVYSNYNEPRVLLVDDVNQDQKDDIIVGSFRDNRLAWHQSIEQPVFLDQPDDVTICQNGQVQFSVSLDNADSYRWQRTDPWANWFEDIENDEVFSGVQSEILTIDIPDNSLNHIKVRCIVSFLDNEFISEEAVLTVDALIESDAGEDQNICSDQSNLYGSWYSGGSGLWTIVQGYAVLSDPNSDYCPISEVAPGENIFRWTITNGSCVSEDEVTILRYEDVQVSVPQTQFNVTEENQNVTLSVNSSGSIITHQWYKGNMAIIDDDRISGSQTAQLTISNVVEEDEGNYYCKVEGECNTVQGENIFLDVQLTGLEDIESQYFNVFPNPANEIISIECIEKIEKIQIYNNQGQLILETETDNSSIIVPIGSLIPGNYLIKVTTPSHSGIVKFIKD